MWRSGCVEGLVVEAGLSARARSVEATLLGLGSSMSVTAVSARQSSSVEVESGCCGYQKSSKRQWLRSVCE